MKKAIITAAGSNMHEVLECSLPTFEWFGQRHGYDLIVDRSLPDHSDHGNALSKKARWHKLDMFKEALKTFEVVVWLDADVMIKRFDRDIIADIDPDCFQALVMEAFWYRFNPNTGVWVMRKDPESLDFITAVQAIGQQKMYWADQGAVCKVLGWEVEEKEVFHAKPVHYSSFLARTSWLPPEWNPLGLASRWPSRVLHFPSRSNEERIPLMKAAFAKIRPPKTT